MFFICKRALFFIFISFMSSAWAGLTEDFNQIKNLGRNMEMSGTICEEIARLDFARKYPYPEYSVVTGIQYTDAKGNTLGELDLVVFNNATQIAKIIAEVKCWKDPKQGLQKAKDQRLRFQKYIHSSRTVFFKWLLDPSKKLTKTQFNKTNEFYFISQKGTLSSGFDYELPYTLNELMELRLQVIRCQHSGQCLKPKN